jgi:hypothetical protein
MKLKEAFGISSIQYGKSDSDNITKDPSQLDKLSANDVEKFYNESKLSKEQLIQWCKQSASGEYPRVYAPIFRSAPEGAMEKVWLKRIDIDSKGNDVPNYKDLPEYKLLMGGE